jgi:hypothetical protein
LSEGVSELPTKPLVVVGIGSAEVVPQLTALKRGLPAEVRVRVRLIGHECEDRMRDGQPLVERIFEPHVDDVGHDDDRDVIGRQGNVNTKQSGR